MADFTKAFSFANQRKRTQKGKRKKKKMSTRSTIVADATMGEGKKKKKVSWRSRSSSFGGYIREQKGRLYIIRSCIVMLLCWHDWLRSWVWSVLLKGDSYQWRCLDSRQVRLFGIDNKSWLSFDLFSLVCLLILHFAIFQM